jgi:hypothetical protein
VAGLEVEWYLTKLDETTLDPDQLGKLCISLSVRV